MWEGVWDGMGGEFKFAVPIQRMWKLVKNWNNYE